MYILRQNRECKMLIGEKKKKPNLARLQRIKKLLSESLDLPETSTITVNQLSCHEEGCPPVETVVALLRPGLTALQHKIHKPVDQLQVNDLVKICEDWGFNVDQSSLKFKKMEI